MPGLHLVLQHCTVSTLVRRPTCCRLFNVVNDWLPAVAFVLTMIINNWVKIHSLTFFFLCPKSHLNTNMMELSFIFDDDKELKLINIYEKGNITLEETNNLKTVRH